MAKGRVNPGQVAKFTAGVTFRDEQSSKGNFESPVVFGPWEETGESEGNARRPAGIEAWDLLAVWHQCTTVKPKERYG